MLVVKLHPKAIKDLKKIPAQSRKQIWESLDELKILAHPLQHRHVIKLEGGSGYLYRLRVGEYRIKLEFSELSEVFIYRIQHRQAGY